MALVKASVRLTRTSRHVRRLFFALVNMADPGSLGNLEHDDGQSQVGSAQQSEDPDIEPDCEDLDPMNLLDHDPSLWPPMDPEFVPLVDELRSIN